MSCGTEHILLLSSDGEIYSWGKNRYGQCGIDTSIEVREPNVSGPTEKIGDLLN